MPTRTPERGSLTAKSGSESRPAFRWPAERREPQPPKRAWVARDWRDWVRTGILAAGIIAAVAVLLVPAPDGLTAAGKNSFAVFLLCTTLWVTNALPVGITGLLAVGLLGLTGAMAPADAFAAFGNSAVFFILGVFILAAALIRTELSKRIALAFLSRFDGSPFLLATGMSLIAALLTVFMPAQATVAMLFPIAFELARAMRLSPGESAYGKVLFLSLAWGAMVGSNASFLGSTRAPLALGMLSKNFGTTITFGQWLLAAAPMVLVGMLVVPLLLRFCFPKEPIDTRAAHAALCDAVHELGPMGSREGKVAIVMLLTIGAWMFLGGRTMDFAVIALLAAVAMFVLRVLRWEDLEGYIHWNVVLMYGGAIALGIAIDRSRAAEWAAASIVGDVKVPTYLAIAGLGLATMVLSEFMSNAAAVAVMLPIGFGLAGQIGASPVALVFAASIGGGSAFTLPISSAPNTIAFASGFLKMTDFVRVGTLMTLSSLILLLLLARFWWPVIGIL